MEGTGRGVEATKIKIRVEETFIKICKLVFCIFALKWARNGVMEESGSVIGAR
jgi:hypothetical protein